jgi:hypothetical protein
MVAARVGDVGVRIEVETGRKMESATKAVLKVLKPNASAQIEWVCAPDGTKLVYVTDADSFNIKGTYKVAAYVEFDDGTKLTGQMGSFEVTDVLA